MMKIIKKIKNYLDNLALKFYKSKMLRGKKRKITKQ